MARLSITKEVQGFLSKHIHQGDYVIDATLGNGHDALFLAELIGDQGHLFGFDIQSDAIKATEQRLATGGLRHRASLVHKGHEHMSCYIPAHLHDHITCIMFNLGYLPGGDKSVTTGINCTLAALDQGCGLLSCHGYISILAYTGHAGGMEEFNATQTWAEQLPKKTYSIQAKNFLPQHKRPPQWILIEKLAPDSAE